MIFVTVGGQTPFDRLIGAVDDWAGARGRDDVFAQIGRTELRPRHVRFAHFLAPNEFRSKVLEARVVVAHAGMGTILTALEVGRPLLVLPRRAALRETRNDHQLATARRFGERGVLVAVADERELALRLDGIDALAAATRISNTAPPPLVEALRSFIFRR